MARSASIVATGRHLPGRCVTNDELRAHFERHGKGEVIDQFAERSGIRQRWWAEPQEATSDLALHAARQALARAGRQAKEVDLIILGTDTPDQTTPATSVILQAKLGASRAGTFDVGCACASFPTALAIAAGLIATNPQLRCVLVVGAYLMQRLADPDDPMIFFYGDGAGAAVVEPSETDGICASAFLADGQYADHWGIAAGGTREPASSSALAQGHHQVRLKERYPPEINQVGWIQLFHELAASAQFQATDVDWAIFTQVNADTITTTSTELGIPLEKAPRLMDHYGYTGSACIPITLDHLRESQPLAKDSLITLIGSGVGYNMAGVAVRFAEQGAA